MNGLGEEISHTVLAEGARRPSSADSISREGWKGSS
jgi:hypothetical protein